MPDLDKWIEISKQCKYLPEHDLKVSRKLGQFLSVEC